MTIWRLAWLFLLALLLYPIVGFVAYALDVVPGGGPQGGEVMALFGLLYWLVWQAIAGLHWVLLARRRVGARWQRWLVGLSPSLALLVTIAWIERGPAIPAGLVVAAILWGSQAWAVWANRPGSAG